MLEKRKKLGGILESFTSCHDVQWKIISRKENKDTIAKYLKKKKEKKHRKHK